MNNKPHRINWQRVKSLHTYTVEELASTVGSHRNTVRHWIKLGLPVIDSKRPTIMAGHAVREFLSKRRAARKRPCLPGQMYCLKCRHPRRPADGVAAFEPDTALTGALAATCGVCGGRMFRRVSMAKLADAQGDLSVQFKRPEERIRDTPDSNLDSDSSETG